MRRPTDTTPCRSVRAPAFLLAVAILSGGCERRPVFAPVEGTVLRNGKPVAKAEVAFFAEGETVAPRTAGLTDADGHYRLRSSSGDDGAVVGTYRVCLFDRSRPFQAARASGKSAPPGASPKAPAVAGPTARPKEIIPPPPEYGRIEQTPLRAEVRPGAQVIDFQLP